MYTINKVYKEHVNNPAKRIYTTALLWYTDLC